MRQYEVMIIIDPTQNERTLSASLEKFFEPVRKAKGTIDNVDIWGKRRLEYPINKKDEGIYAVVDLTCEPGTVQELDRVLNLSETTMRTKVMRKDS